MLTGLIQWLRGLFGSDEPAAPSRVAASSVPPKRLAASGATSVRPSPRASSAPERLDLTDGTEYASAVELTFPQQEQVAELAERCRAAFDASRLEAQAFPTRASRILALLEDPDFDVDQLVALAQRDPALSASVLRVANSAVSASLQQIDGLREAILRLGAQTVAGIAVALASRSAFEIGSDKSKGAQRAAWNVLWLQSVASAFSAGSLCIQRRAGDLEQCFVGGMLHDIGKTFALRTLAEPGVTRGHLELEPEVVAAVLEEVHVEFGSSVARAWRLPKYVIDMCEEHHAFPSRDHVERTMVQLASGLTAIQLSPYHREGLDLEVQAAARALAMDVHALRAARTDVRENIKKARAV